MTQEVIVKRTHRRDKVVRRFLLFLVLLAMVLFAAPAFVSQTSMRDRFLAGVLPPEAGTLTTESASFGWLTPVSLSGVTIADPAGNVILRAESLALEKTVLDLIGDRTNLGTIRIHKPVVYAIVRPDGSNVEDLIAALDDESNAPNEPAQPLQPAPPKKPFAIEVTSGSVAVKDIVTGETVIHDPIDAALTISEAGLTNLAANGFAHALVLPPRQQLPQLPMDASQNRRGGAFSLSLGPNEAGMAEARFKLVGLQLKVLEPWLRRIDPQIQIAGGAEGTGTAVWRPTGPAINPADALSQGLQTSGRLQMSGLRFASSATNGDAVTANAADIPWRLTAMPDGRLQIDQLGLASDFASATVTGGLTPRELAALTQKEWIIPAAVKVDADLDLAKLAQVAPNALRLRKDVRLTSGRLQLTATTRTADQTEIQGRRIDASIQAADLVATRAGKPVEWRQPITLKLDARQMPAGLRIETLTAESDFLSGTLSGDATQLDGELSFDLDKLVQHAKQLFDLGQWDLAGRGAGTIRIARGEGNRFEATTKANIAGCVISHAGRPIVQERRLDLQFTGRGESDARTHRPLGFVSAELNVNAGEDRLTATLLEPTAVNSLVYPLDIKLTGELAAWQRRLGFVIPNNADGLSIAGNIKANATGRFGSQRIEVRTAEATAIDFDLTAGDYRIQQPKVRITGDAVWDAASGRIASQAGELVTSTIAVRARELLVQPAGATGPAQAAGELAIRANLERLAIWVPGLMGTKRLAGETTGTVRLTGGQGVVSADLTLDTKDFILGDVANTARGGQPEILWQEQTLRLQGNAGYNSAANQVTVNGLSIRSGMLSATVTGKIDRPSADGAVQLAGTIDYDLAQLAPLIADSMGEGIQLIGRHQGRFELAGVLSPGSSQPGLSQAPLRQASTGTDRHWSQRWTGRVAAPWTSASLYGLPIGQGTLSAQLQNGVLRGDPLQFAVGQGQLTTQPGIRFDPEPAEWGLPAGQLLSNVRITPEVSEQMLKYIAPVLADATQTDGLFSMRTDGLTAPAADLAAMQTNGQIDINSVTVMPGPRVEEWISLTRQVEALIKNRDPSVLTRRPQPTLLSMTDRTINFQVANRRVYHQGLEFLLGEANVISTGSVGFDETLDLTLTVPIQDRWIRGEQYLAGLSGQNVVMRVGGTFNKPRVDRRALQQLSGQLIGTAAQGAVQKEVGRALDKLFGR